MTSAASPARKRVKLESPSPPPPEEEEEYDNCSICLQPLVDRTVVPTCSHEFCFDCLVVWTEQSRKCPLCAQTIGEYLIHRIRSRYDYQKHFLAPLAKPGLLPLRQQEAPVRRRRRRREWGRRDEEEADKLDRSIEKRRWVYQHGLYAKHVASNGYTKYRPYPTPAQFAASQEMVSKTTMFLRRELRVWDDLDVEFFTPFTVSLMKSIDIRSESAIKLLAEFLDIDTGGRATAEHFSHEVYSYVRSPFKDLFVYDSVVQYDTPPDASSPPRSRPRRWRENDDHVRRRSRSRSSSPYNRAVSPDERSPSRSISWSPSSRQYPSVSSAPRTTIQAAPIEPPDLKGKSRATEPPDSAEMSTGLIPDVKGKTRADTHSSIIPPVPGLKGKSREADEPHVTLSSSKGTARKVTPPSTVLPVPDLKGKSRATGEPDITSSSTRGKARTDTPPSTVPRLRSKKPIRTPMDSLRAHLGSNASSSSPNLLSRLGGDDIREREVGLARSPVNDEPTSANHDTQVPVVINSGDEDLGRERLLGKLLEERKRASRAVVDYVERRLRTRALARVRLAAEKRAAQG